MLLFPISMFPNAGLTCLLIFCHTMGSGGKKLAALPAALKKHFLENV